MNFFSGVSIRTYRNQIWQNILDMESIQRFICVSVSLTLSYGTFSEVVANLASRQAILESLMIWTGTLEKIVMIRSFIWGRDRYFGSDCTSNRGPSNTGSHKHVS